MFIIKFYENILCIFISRHYHRHHHRRRRRRRRRRRHFSSIFLFLIHYS